jgi:hypothetical protein
LKCSGRKTQEEKLDLLRQIIFLALLLAFNPSCSCYMTQHGVEKASSLG